MAIDRAGTLIDLLREHRLLEPAQLEDLSRTPDVQDTDPQVLGQCLIELGWLTPFQVDRLIHQRPQDLILGSYHLLERLGQGDSGPAFQARKPGKAGTVALKIIPKPRLADPQLLACFQQEVRTAAQLQHPNIAPVAAVGQHGNLYLFAREFVEGADLGRMVRELGPLPAVLACNAVRQAALALQCAHDKGLSHRRVKPSNLIVADQPGAEATVKLVDFGLGQLKAGAKPGLDVPGDLEALGQTLSFLLTGQNSPPASDGLPAEVRDIVWRLAPNRIDRFHTAREASEALEPFSHEPPPAQAVPVNGASVEPANIPFATAAVEAIAMPAPAPYETIPQPEPAAMAVAVAEAVPLEGIAVPVMGTVGLVLDAVPAADEPAHPSVISAVASPEVVADALPAAQTTWSEPALATPGPEPIAPSVAVAQEAVLSVTTAATPDVAPNSSLIELLGAGIAGEKPGEDDWPPVKHAPESEPEPAVSPPAPISASEQTPPPPMELLPASPPSDSPEAVASAVSEPVPGGYFMDQPPTTGAITEEAGDYPMSAAVETTPRRAPAKKKWSRSSILWIIVGLLLHLVAAVILVIAVIALMNREKPPTKNNRPGVPSKQKGKSRAQLGEGWQQRH